MLLNDPEGRNEKGGSLDSRPNMQSYIIVTYTKRNRENISYSWIRARARERSLIST